MKNQKQCFPVFYHAYIYWNPNPQKMFVLPIGTNRDPIQYCLALLFCWAKGTI